MDKTHITGIDVMELMTVHTLTSVKCTEDGCGELLTDLEVKLYGNVCGYCYSMYANAGEDFDLFNPTHND